MADKKKDDSIDRPKPPEAQMVPTPGPAPTLHEPTAPMSMDEYMASYAKWYPTLFRQQAALAPYAQDLMVQEQQKMMSGAFAEQMRQMPISAATMYGLDTQYIPQYTSLFNQQAAAANPEFFNIYGQLGSAISSDLTAGYDLGAGLEREIQQSIRGAQTARGNILGAAPTAQEAFGTGAASVDLYNQRLANAQNFLQGKQPTDLWGALQMARPSTVVNAPYYPSTDYLSGASQAATQTANTATAAQSDYNSALMSYNNSSVNAYSAFNTAMAQATEINNQGIFDTYNAATDYWQYDEAVRRGLYSTPSTGSSSGSNMLGTAIAGVGTGVATGIGLSVAGAGAGTAIAGGAAAAVSAAGAAICWLARLCIPNRWEEFQRWLFTSAPEKLRRLYLYNARRLAREINDDEAVEIGDLMNDCLNLRSLS